MIKINESLDVRIEPANCGRCVCACCVHVRGRDDLGYIVEAQDAMIGCYRLSRTASSPLGGLDSSVELNSHDIVVNDLD